MKQKKLLRKLGAEWKTISVLEHGKEVPLVVLAQIPAKQKKQGGAK